MLIETGKPLISIIMVNYNGLKYLKRSIPLILKLKYNNFEFIVVDNGSTDGSIDFLKNIDGVKLIESPRMREKNFACNFGVNLSKGDYLLLLDNDIEILHEDILAELLEYHNNLEKAGCINLAYINEGETKTKGYGNFFSFYFTREMKPILKSEINKFDKIEIGCPYGIGIFISKKLWLQVGGYDDFLKFGGDDADLGIKLWLAGYKNYLYAKTIQVHIGMPERNDNIKYCIKFKEVFFAHLYTIFKNYTPFNAFVVICCYSIFTFMKSIKQSLYRADIGPILSFFKGYSLFFINLKVAIIKRRMCQLNRVVKKDIFLSVKQPHERV